MPGRALTRRPSTLDVSGVFGRAHARRPSDEEMLLKQLFDGYNPAARPVINSSSTVDVKMMFSLLQIQELVRRVAYGVHDVAVLTLVTCMWKFHCTCTYVSAKQNTVLNIWQNNAHDIVRVPIDRDENSALLIR